MGGEKRCTDVRNDVIWLKSILHRFQNFNFPFFIRHASESCFFLFHSVSVKLFMSCGSFTLYGQNRNQNEYRR